MGDVIHSLPAVAALREAHPDAVLGWAIEERWSALLSSASARLGRRSPGKPLVDHLHLVDTMAWRTAPFSDSTWREISQTIRGLRSVRYDISIDIQGAIKSSVLGRLARPRRRFGFAQPWEHLATMFYDHQVQATGTHIVERNFCLAAAAGAQSLPSVPFPIPHDAVAEVWVEAELRKRNLRDFVLVNPGAGWGSKCWPAERFGELARRFSTFGLATLINFGPGEEALTAAVESSSAGAATRISCSLAELIALTRRATVFVGGDTGPLHLAVAVNTPTVALFGPTDPARNGPYGGRAIVLRSPQSLTTYKRSANFDDGLASITVDQVLDATSRLLERPFA